MNYRLVLNYLPSAVVVILFLIAWQAYVVLFHVPSFLLPPPTSIATILASPSGDWFGNSWTTLYETIAGFVMAAVIGIPLAIALMYSVWFNRVAYPIILLFQVIPKVALAPLIFLLMNFGLIPRIIVTFLVAFFPIIIDTLAGLNSLEPDYVDLLRSVGANNYQIFTLARLHNAFPQIFAGLKVSITLALIGAIVAEFVQSNSGLGYILLEAMANGSTVTAFGAIVLLAIMGVGLYLIFVVLERMTTGWYIRSKAVRR